MDGFMAGFYGSRVPGTPGAPPPPVGHPYPGVPPGPHRPSPWPSAIPGYDYEASRALLGGGPPHHGGFPPYYHPHALGQHHPYAAAAAPHLFAAEAARMAEAHHRAAIESQQRALAAAVKQKEESQLHLSAAAASRNPGLPLSSDPFSLPGLDNRGFTPRRDFLDPLPPPAPASNCLASGFDRSSSFHPPASHLSSPTASQSHTLVANQIVTTTTTSTTTFGQSLVRSASNDIHVDSGRGVVAAVEEEEDELLLVDDFDGQCCRTYPNNHSKILAWRKSKEEKERRATVTSVTVPVKETQRPGEKVTNHPHHRSSLSPKPADSRKSDSKHPVSTPVVTTNSSIPVGIAIGRQRHQDGASSLAAAAAEKKRISAETTDPMPDQAYPAVPTAPASSWGVNVPPGPHSGPSVYPSTSPFGSAPPHWIPPHGMPHPMGPIPMGYQLAKDPLTGQMLLIPTDSGQPHHGGLWPSNPYDSLRLQPSPAAAHYHHQMYLQQQQQQQRHLHYMRAASAMRSSPSGSGLTPRLGLEPETITVSDDEDEPPIALVKKPSSKVEAVPDLPPPKELKCETPLDCSSKANRTSTTFVPYRESLSSPSLPSTSSASLSSSSSFMPSFSVAALSKPDVKLEQPEMVKPETIEAYHPPADDCHQSPASIIKEEPKDDFHLEVGEEAHEPADKVPDVATTCIDETVKEEKSNDSSALAMEEAADLLLSLADVVDPPRTAETNVKEEEIEEIERSDFDGLDLLLEGISLQLKNDVSWSQSFSFPPGLEMLYAVTREDASTFGIGDDLSVLCTVTEEDYFNYLNWVDPMIELKSRFNLHNYKCETSQDLCKQFISEKIKKFKKLNDGQNENDDSPRIAGLESLDEVIKKIKNTEIMSQLEVELRSQLAQLQDLYKDKQKEMSRLKSSPKKMTPGGGQASSRSRTRGPGRPKKRCLKSSAKTKMGRPRKRRHSEEDEYNEEDDDYEEEEESNNLSPPVLQPWSTSSRSPSPPPLFRHTNDELVTKKPVTSSTTTATTTSTTGGLLKPPKLTASFSPASGVVKKSSNAVTNLSMLNARFMKGKANPFQNLMKLATVPSGPGNSKEADDAADDEDDEEEERESSSSTDDEVENRKLSLSSSKHVEASKESAESGCDRKYSDPEDGSASKRRKCEKPKRHCGSTETIVSKQPKNLFMMNCMTIQRGFSDKPTSSTTTASKTVKSSTAVIDEYDFRDNDDDDEMDDADEDERWSLQSSSKNKMFTQYRDPVHPSPPPPPPTATLPRSKPLWSPASITKPTQPKASSLSPQIKAEKSTKCEVEKKKSFKDSPSPAVASTSSSSTSSAKMTPKPLPKGIEMLRSAILSDSDLTDGLRILILQEGRFWPARLNSTQLPDVYGVVVEKQRGNRPLILPRDDLLKEAVLEIKPKSKHQLPYGTRVCVFWSSVYNCLFPATVEALDIPVKDNMVEVVLDDGDRRQVDIANVRMLPHNYSRVVYDPDPISSLRKRRISADSVDSGSASGREMHPHTAHDLSRLAVAPTTASPQAVTPTKSVTSDVEATSSPIKRKKEKSGKKHKKKHKHHHCKHKHKKHNKSIENDEEEEDNDNEDEDGEEEDVVVGEEDDLRIKLDGSFNNTTTYSIRSPIYHARSEESNHDEEGDDESSDDDGFSDDDHVTTVKTVGEPKKPHVDGINPVTGRPLWHWYDEGYRRPGSKGKAKKLFHRAIKRGGEVINVGDCAVFLSTARVDRPYIGQVELLWETWNGNMMVKVKWFYHPEEIETHGKRIDLKLPGGLFQSPHTDENDVQTISHKCEVLPLKEHSKLVSSIESPSSSKKKKTSSAANSNTGDLYYLAGSYDPTAMLVNFQSGVLKQQT